ncbi:MAG: aldo/keto reductase [Acidimicrobiales bacterium]
MDHVDLIYSMPPPEGLPVADLVAQVVGLVSSGRARAWGIGNWRAPMLAEAVEVCRAEGFPLPCAAQLPYSLVTRDWVEDEQMAALLATGETGLVASYVLAGGVLSGKYLRGESGRADDISRMDPSREAEAARALDDLAGEWGVPAPQLALAFALTHPHLASLLFGATTPGQLRENLGALSVVDSLDADQLARLRAVGEQPSPGTS